MENINNYDYLLSDLTKLSGVGKKTMEILKKKKVNNIFDLLWRLPKSYTDRSLTRNICDLKIGDVQTIKIFPTKYQFPRIRNLPNKVNCEDETGKIDCIFFNSYEGYVRKILPLNEQVSISGKITYRSNYRGTKEMDKLLGSFTKKHLDTLNEEGLKQLSNLLDYDDENLYKYNQGRKTTIKIDSNHVADLFKNYVYVCE